MQAIVVSEPGDPDKLVLREVPDPVPGQGQIVIDVRATALNRADLLQRRGLYPPPKGETEILGLECAGVVAAHGPGCASPELGARVMALLPGGGYAERVVVPARMAMPVPEGMELTAAAAIPEAFLTAQEALIGLGKLQPGQWVLIHASAGGVGSAAVQMAHALGAKVIATAGSDEKLARVKRLGADVLVNYKSGDFAAAVQQATGGKGTDLILDFVGGAYWEKHASCLAIGGRVIVIGVLGGPMAEVNLAQLLMRRTQILGLVMRSRPVSDKIAISAVFLRDWLPRFSTGALAPVIDCVLPLADAAKAHERMEANLNVGKIVLSVGH